MSLKVGDAIRDSHHPDTVEGVNGIIHLGAVLPKAPEILFVAVPMLDSERDEDFRLVVRRYRLVKEAMDENPS